IFKFNWLVSIEGNNMEEKIFFESNDVKVTNSRFITGNQTYAMSNVTSVKPHKQSPNRMPWIFALFMGVFFILIKSYLIGFGLIGLAIFVLYNQKPLYTVILKTSSGENRALHTNEQEYLNQVINALNEAIVHRG
ncbi:DUF6232 family protein, partial [Vibrio cholerae]